jgi:hypothetical protein
LGGLRAALKTCEGMAVAPLVGSEAASRRMKGKRRWAPPTALKVSLGKVGAADGEFKEVAEMEEGEEAEEEEASLANPRSRFWSVLREACMLKALRESVRVWVRGEWR